MAGLPACAPSGPRPPWPDEVQATLLIHAPPEGPAHGFATSRAEPLPLAVPEQDLLALGYRFPVEALMMPIRAAVPSAAAGAALPSPSSAFRLAADGEWQVLEPEAVDPQAFLRPSPDLSTCAAVGGCWTSEDRGRCRIPCEVTPPRAPELPRRPCPEGWLRSDVADGVHTCAPDWPDRVTCDAHAWQPFASPQCQPIATCPDGPWPASLHPERPTLYVRPGAEGGDGSENAPFGALGPALAAAPRGAVVLIGEGSLRVPNEIAVPELTVQGLCPARTRIETSGVGLQVSAPSVQLLDLTIRSDTQDALRVAETASVSARRLELYAPRGAGVDALGPASLDTVRVEAQTGARVLAARLVAQHVDVLAPLGLRCALDADLSLEDATLRTPAGADPQSQIELAGCREAELTRVYMSAPGHHGIRATAYRALLGSDLAIVDAGGTAASLRPNRAPALPSRTHLRRVAARGQRAALHITAHEAELDDLFIDGSEEVAIIVDGAFLDGPGTTLRGVWVTEAPRVLLARRDDALRGVTPVRVEDLVVTERRAPQEVSVAVRSAQGTPLEVQRAWLHVAGVTAFRLGCGGAARLQDVTLRGFGAGVIIESDEPSELDRLSLQGSFIVGIHQRREDSCDIARLDTRDVYLAGQGAGRGIQLDVGGTFTGERLTVSDFTEGVFVGSTQPFELSEARIRDNAVGLSVPKQLNLLESLHAVDLVGNRNPLVRR